MKPYSYLYILCAFFGLSACSTSNRIPSSVGNFFTRDTLFSDHFTGFLLYDPVKGENIYAYHGNHFFTPASNTKILTMYSALEVLPDTLPSVKYMSAGDTLYLRGMGDPTTLNPAFGHQDEVLKFIAGFKQPVVFCKDHFHNNHFGEGWAWDDYPYYYQAEKSDFPVFGNLLHLSYHPSREELILYPGFVNVNYEINDHWQLYRDLQDNNYEFNWPESANAVHINSPLHMTDSIIEKVFNTYLTQDFRISESCPASDHWQTFYSTPLDTALSVMMKESDNFIAEQLILEISGLLSDSLNTEKTIKEIKARYLSEIADQIEWHDGSGLSRYNLFTPEAIVTVLNKIYHRLSIAQIKKIFAAGGQSGTIARWYAADNGLPFVYAKTGSLSNVHCLSGYVFTDSGKILIFSFMHNNFTGPSNTLKINMNKVLQYIKSNF
ncbi:MAG: D-alanyl-D-alanine carboxypeptidase [Saprospiraceae bacterium]|nr:D-alanyl-D-alanine carboxypeptidase [Saprospiraceae bacterium]